jgi:hypothetical protein
MPDDSPKEPEHSDPAVTGGRRRERTLSLTLAGAEGLVRLLVRVPPPPYPVCAMPPEGGELYTYDAERFWKPRANVSVQDGFYRTNSLGLREDEFPKDPASEPAPRPRRAGEERRHCAGRLGCGVGRSRSATRARAASYGQEGVLGPLEVV